jgi:signal transduction histidine kinase
MAAEDRNPRPERDQTDVSIRTERSSFDAAAAAKQAHTEEDADELVDRARKNADAVLSAARDRADQKLDPAQSRPLIQARATIALERALEDDAVRAERATADASLRQEREEQAQILSGLLPLERAKTDRYLLTERARSDDALASRDDFLGIVSHDLRNLLSGIVLSAGMLAKTPDGADEDRERTKVGAERIQRYAARMNRLIGDLVDVVSIEAGKLAIYPERTDATSLIVEAVDAFTLAASDKGVTLVLGSEERPRLLADFDRGRMLQVLANLITNALKFTPRGGMVSVRAERSGDDLCLAVSDTGCGIPGHMLQSVFERFWQVGEGDRRGLGLGLYISSCIVEAHGGRIWAESEPGQGSQFHFTIPGAGPAQASHAG